MNKFLGAVLLCMITLYSCETEGECGNDYTTSFKIEYKKMDDSAAVSNDTVIFSKVYAQSRPDSLFVEMDTVSSLTLTIDPSMAFSTFIFESDEDIDTITFSYVVRPLIISELCEPVLVINQFDTLNNTYDSLIIVNSELKESDAQTIQIFR